MLTTKKDNPFLHLRVSSLSAPHAPKRIGNTPELLRFPSLDNDKQISITNQINFLLFLFQKSRNAITVIVLVRTFVNNSLLKNRSCVFYPFRNVFAYLTRHAWLRNTHLLHLLWCHSLLRRGSSTLRVMLDQVLSQPSNWIRWTLLDKFRHACDEERVEGTDEYTVIEN